MKMYNLTGCPYCAMVCNKLNELGIECEKIEVPRDKGQRHEVFQVSNQYTVPVLVDGDVMLDDEEKIIPYLEEKYGKVAK
jgi:glutaredoxin